MGHRDPWDDYRVRRNVALVAYGGFLPMVFGVGPALAPLAGNVGPWAVVALGWAAFAEFADRRLLKFPCPRCGEPFLTAGAPPRHRLDSGQCLHCGLPKWADPGEWEENDRPEADPPN